MSNLPAPYQRAHAAVKQMRGAARGYQCPCGKPALDWAYQFTAGDAELRSEDGSRPYSTNPDDYMPMCRSCHIAFDMKNDLTMADKRRVGIADGRVKALQRVAEMRETDPAFVDKMRAVLRNNLTVRARCNVCGKVSTRQGLGNHKKHSGHIGYTIVNNGRKELS